MTRRWLALTLAALLAAGCAAGSSRRPAEAAPELSAVAVYGRHAAVRGKVDVRLANHGAAPVEVVSLQVRHPLFEVLPATGRRSTLPADGRPRIVPVPFGEPRCAATGGAGARVVVGVRTAGGVRAVAVPLSDGEPGLVRAHRLSCAAARVAEAVDLGLGPWVPEPGPAARAVLRLHRRGPGEVVVTGLGGNILFTVETAAGEPVLVLPAGQDAAEVEVVVRATRCEAHALTESKTSATFPVFVQVDGGEPVLVQVTAPAPGRAALQELLDRTCTPGA